MPPGHYHMPSFPLHPGYPVRPGIPSSKRESPNEIEKPSPKEDRSYVPGLIPVNHSSSSEERHRGSMIAESSHVSGPSYSSGGIGKPASDVSYHPVRRRGEAAAMVDIGHGR